MVNKYNEIDTTHYDAVQLDEYNGTYSIKAVQKGQNDVYYLRWVFTSKWSKTSGGFVPDDKKRPMHIVLGDKQTALNTLREIINDLQGV